MTGTELLSKTGDILMCNSYILGDHPSDVKLAINSRANGIFLLTGHGQKHYRELNSQCRQNIRICSNLKSATKAILKSVNDGK